MLAFKHNPGSFGTPHTLASEAQTTGGPISLHTAIGPDLLDLGFQVEASKKSADKLERPVFFGENGIPTLRYEIDVICMSGTRLG